MARRRVVTGIASHSQPRRVAHCQRGIDTSKVVPRGPVSRSIDPPCSDTKAVDDRHPEAGAALLRREERLVDPRAHVIRNPGPSSLTAI